MEVLYSVEFIRGYRTRIIIVPVLYEVVRGKFIALVFTWNRFYNNDKKIRCLFHFYSFCNQRVDWKGCNSLVWLEIWKKLVRMNLEIFFFFAFSVWFRKHNSFFILCFHKKKIFFMSSVNRKNGSKFFFKKKFEMQNCQTLLSN